MRGKIETLGSGSSRGRIRADDGTLIAFDVSGILAYDVGRMSVGRSVTFEIDKRTSTAVNVTREQASVPALDKHAFGGQFRYMGFEQHQDVRVYRFEAAGAEGARRIEVTIDLKLFTKHHIGMQEGPGLCLRHLAGTNGTGETRSALTDGDMLAFIASRPVAGAPRAFRRKHTPAAPQTAEAARQPRAPKPFERPSAWRPTGR